MAHRSDTRSAVLRDDELLALDDDALVGRLAEVLAAQARAAGAAMPDPGTLLDDARRLLARWNAELYGACCTDDPAYDDLRGEIGDVARIADALLVDALTDALASASKLPRSVTRLIAAFAVKHGFEASRGLACAAWSRVVGPVSPASP
ncbi:MAG TPA: hypothetical protein VN771_00365 [Candidatus Baltobacteraceae bacterium]|nr:hypothetical protein [Candidatus Baltobacteraceae bacterium]